MDLYLCANANKHHRKTDIKLAKRIREKSKDAFRKMATEKKQREQDTKCRHLSVARTGWLCLYGKSRHRHDLWLSLACLFFRFSHSQLLAKTNENTFRSNIHQYHIL